MLNKKLKFAVFLIISLFFFGFIANNLNSKFDNDQFISYTCNPKKTQVKLFWKDKNGQVLKSFANLKAEVESNGQSLLLAMNAGMYMEDNSPLGLYIDNGRQIRKLNLGKSNSGNFYLKPNGVFYLTKNKEAKVIETSKFKQSKDIEFATQSGPMLIIEGEIHPAFTKGSANLNIRNGVGILPNNELIFAISKVPVNFYDFAMYFKNLGCKNALYLDGSVSRAYIPEKKWGQLEGNFGVLIGVVE